MEVAEDNQGDDKLEVEVNKNRQEFGETEQKMMQSKKWCKN